MKKLVFIAFLFFIFFSVSAKNIIESFTDENSLNKKKNNITAVSKGSQSFENTSPYDISGSSEALAEVCHTLNLNSGWNIFSVPNSAEPANIQDVFQPLIDDGSLIKIQDEVGNTLEDWSNFGGWRNKIGELSPTEGYKIQLSADRSLEVCGQAVSYPFEIPLNEGWNIIGFPHTVEVDAMKVLQQLINNNTLVQVQDGNGNSIFYQNGWQNDIGNFIPGEGYRIKMTSSDNLWIYENYDTGNQSNYELQVRSGLPNFLSKVKNNESVNVVYFGGSITYAEGWRPQTANWMRDYFNNNNIKDYNASIGGTTSEFGAYRLGRDVLPRNPDLVLVEFAVNDAGRNYTDIIRSMEGIVRQVKNANSNTELCFVYTVKTSTLDNTPPDNLHETVQAMEEVAEHYQIPTIHFGLEVKEQVDNYELIFKGSSTYIDGTPVFSMDGIHPYPETGHVVYTDVFKRSIQKLETSSLSSKVYPSPLREDNLVDAKMVELSKISLTNNWEPLSSDNFPDYDKFSDRASGAMFTATPGDKMHFRFTGTKFGLTDIIGPRTGYIEVAIDGSIVVTVKRFDPYCSTYRVHFFTSRELADTEHEVTITLLDANIDKRSILNDKSAYDRDPSAFEGPEWYPIRLLLDGDLIVE